MDFLATFPHRRNRDGSFDSICGICFATVGSAATERELEPMEMKHVCQGMPVVRRSSRNQTVPATGEGKKPQA
jgi:hypothetical protein